MVPVVSAENGLYTGTKVCKVVVGPCLQAWVFCGALAQDCLFLIVPFFLPSFQGCVIMFFTGSMVGVMSQYFGEPIQCDFKGIDGETAKDFCWIHGSRQDGEKKLPEGIDGVVKRRIR